MDNADVNILDADGKKPTDVARCKRHSDIANFYSNSHILGIGNQLRFNNLALNCLHTASETAWTYTYIFILYNWFTVIYIVTKTLTGSQFFLLLSIFVVETVLILLLTLYRLVDIMFTVHNLVTVVYTDTETVLILPLRLCRLVNMFIVHNLLTIVSTDIETEVIQSVRMYRLVMFTIYSLLFIFVVETVLILPVRLNGLVNMFAVVYILAETVLIQPVRL